MNKAVQSILFFIRRIYLPQALVFICLLSPFVSFADSFVFDRPDKIANVAGNYLQILEDTSNKLTIADVYKNGKFKQVEQVIPNLGITNSSFWLKLSVTNSTTSEEVQLVVQQPMIDEIEAYVFSADGTYKPVYINKQQSFYERLHPNVDFIFDLHAAPNETKEILLRVKSTSQLVVPIKLGTKEVVDEDESTKELLFGIYSGIILVMVLYNLFVYFTVRDKSYLLYVAYILLIGLTQVTLQGFTHKYLWPNNPWLALQDVNITSCLVSIAALEFIRVFLKTREHVPRLHYGILILTGIFVIAFIMTLAGKRMESFKIMQADTALASLFALYVSYRVYKKNYRPARFFLLSWSILLVGAVVFVLKDFGVVPYNTLSTYTIQIASVAEVVLLSFALADKINIFRAEALAAVEENARIVSEQNVMLEIKVTERTTELNESNKELNKTLEELKEAEMQLVESEKMASLGQLTAGIAHEINNPINFVTSNVKPLKRDVEMVISMLEQVEAITMADGPLAEKQKQIADLKEEYDFDYLKTEIEYLLKGINEGSSRTAEIVKGLRIFSRLDEDDLKKASINEGIDSTIIIINNLLDNRIEIKKEYGNIPMVECYPGKLNQVFLNIITNAIHALKSKFKEGSGGIITIHTTNTETTVVITISDNGTGMDENTKKKLFEPFFTTKEVGEGTGLGLSIAYNTIKKHNGNISINSTLGVGTDFIIELPIIHQNI